MKYTHTEEMHNMLSPSKIVPVIYELIHPESVVDIGCGLGTFLRAFKEAGVNEIMGVDGKWCKKELLFKNIEQSSFTEMDLEKKIAFDRRFDLAISLEVAEHLSPGRAPSFVQDLTQLSDVILFSAAIPLQGGDHHLNEQWIDFWEQCFADHDYEMFDVLKPYFWGDQDIFWWYKQNMVLFVKKGASIAEQLKNLEGNKLKNVIHYELFSIVASYREKNAIKRNFKGLVKAVLYKFGLIS